MTMQDGGGEVTKLLARLRSGEAVQGKLVEVVYADLRRIARARMRAERKGHTLSATELVHEYYQRISNASSWEWQDRGQFLAAAARSMRQLLIDHARARQALKRGGGVQVNNLEDVDLVAHVPWQQLPELDVALNRLAQISDRCCRVVEMRFFAGFTEDEVADALGVTRRTVNRDWEFARAWLRTQLGPETKDVR